MNDIVTPVFRFAYRLSGTVETAEDITHDCFLSLIRKPGNFDPGRASLTNISVVSRTQPLAEATTNIGQGVALDEFDDEQFVEPRRQPLRQLLDDELSLKVQEAVSVYRPCSARHWFFLSMKVSL